MVDGGLISLFPEKINKSGEDGGDDFFVGTRETIRTTSKKSFLQLIFFVSIFIIIWMTYY